MDRLERLKQGLGEALARMHDPAYEPTESLRAALGVGEGASPGVVHVEIVRWIETFRPGPEVPSGSRARRYYDVLRNRYVLSLTQEETADRMRLGLRTVQRAQARAIHALAVRISERNQQSRQLTRDGPRPDALEHPQETAQVRESAAWRSQARDELAILRTAAPDATAQVDGAIKKVLSLGEVLRYRRETHIELGFVQPGLVAAVHPVVLHQIVITAITRLARCLSDGRITIYARLEDGKARITFTAIIADGPRPMEADLITDILVPDGGSVDAQMKADTVFLSVWLPSPGTVTVLVVDDNPDIVQFYRRSAAGTRYHIVHSLSARDMWGTLSTTIPDVIVLDVMLPDADGWQVLMRLHENLETRSIPVIVCTVVREEELALSLGAARYLPKPVHPRAFVEALDEIVRQN